MKRVEEMMTITKTAIARMQEEENRIANNFVENEVAPLVEKSANCGRTSVEFVMPSTIPVCATERILQDLGYEVNVTDNVMFIGWGD